MPRLLAAIAILAVFLAAPLSVAHAQTPPATTPTVSTVAVTSNPGTDNTYTTLDVITVTVTFSEPVTATGTPQITLDIGGAQRTAGYAGAGTSTTQLLFSYEVQPVDQDDDGIAVTANSLALNGGTIQSSDATTDATLTHAAQAAANHKVDTEITLVSNLELPDGTPRRISATEAIRIDMTISGSPHLARMSELVLDVKTPSDALTVTVQLEKVVDDTSTFTEFSGSVASAGRQVFKRSDGSKYLQFDDLARGTNFRYFLHIKGSGTGHVELGTTPREGIDSSGLTSWGMSGRLYLSTDGGDSYPMPVLTNFPRFAIIGHFDAILRIQSATITSKPFNGVAYTADEAIEVSVKFNRTISILDSNLSIDLMLGRTPESRRSASLAGYEFPSGLRATDPGLDGFLLAYRVQPGDAAVGGVMLGANPLGDGAEAKIKDYEGSEIAVDFAFPRMEGGVGQAVNGSKTSDCNEIFCAYMVVEEISLFEGAVERGYPYRGQTSTGDAGLSKRTFKYGGRAFVVFTLSKLFGAADTNIALDNVITIAYLGNEQPMLLSNRLGIEYAGKTVPFADSVDSGASFYDIRNSDVQNVPYEFYYWEDSSNWPAGDRILVKIVEVPVTATFDAAAYAEDEGGNFDVTVTLGGAFEGKTVTLPLVATGEGGATSTDFSGVPSELVFMPGETEKTFTFRVTQDTVDDDDESIILSFGTSTPAATVKDGGDHETATVTIRDDDDPEVEVEFGSATYSAGEGGTVDVQVTLSADPERTVVIPLVATNREGATSTDYSGVPNSVTFNPGATTTTFTFMATQDTVDDDGEGVRLAFGPLPDRVSSGAVDETTVSIDDDDHPRITVQFGSATYSVDEGATTTVQVTLSADPERPVTIPITTTNLLGASSLDYSGVPENITFNTGEREMTFTFSVTQDTVDDDGEEVRLGIGAMLPDRVSKGTPANADVNLGDDDDPEVEVEFASATYSAGEGETVDVQLTLSANPERTVVITLVATNQGGATSSDYSAPNSVTFNSGETVQNVTVSVTQDDVDDDDESVKLTFGSPLPPRVTGGSQRETVVNFTDNDDPEVTVAFATTTYSAREGETANVKVTLNADPERTVIIPIVPTDQDGAASTDYSTPLSVRFDTGVMEQTLAFSATQDDVDDDGESVRLSFGPLPDRVSEGAVDETTVSIEDDDHPRITVWFGSAAHAVDEGATTSVQVVLSADPERTVTIPLTTTNLLGASASDYSVPTSVTLDAGENDDDVHVRRDPGRS